MYACMHQKIHTHTRAHTHIHAHTRGEGAGGEITEDQMSHRMAVKHGTMAASFMVNIQ